jgi:4-hydroxythreonine-4-phosphate dehydrogenase
MTFDTDTLPRVALTLGDPAGIGPELIARLLARPDTLAAANVVLVGEPWLWAEGHHIAGREVPTDRVERFPPGRILADT